MIGLVIVSHSPRLAEAAVELAMEMVHGTPPPIRIAAGIDGRFGTDAMTVAGAIDEIGGDSGVLVITDLGSAVLSAGLAVELTESGTRVLVSDGPFVEGITAGVVLAATGAPLEEVAREVSAALGAKRDHVKEAPEPRLPDSGRHSPASGPHSVEEVLINPEGLHARPASMFVQAAGGYDALVDVTNLTTAQGPVAAKSMIGLMSLGAKQGHRIKLDGRGPDAASAVSALRRLLADGFGENPTASTATRG